MNKVLQDARKKLGIPKFEQRCRLTYELARLKKAYKVPGTPENGKHYMLMHMANNLVAKVGQ